MLFRSPQSGTSKAGNPWVKQLFLVDNGEKYNNLFCFELFKDEKVQAFNQYNKVGDHVEDEDVLMILESMKMEIPIEATCAGTLIEIKVSEKDSVEEDQIVAIIEAD